MVDIRCENLSGELERAGKGWRSHIDYPKMLRANALEWALDILIDWPKLLDILMDMQYYND